MRRKKAWLLKQTFSAPLPYDRGDWYSLHSDYGQNHWQHIEIFDSYDNAAGYLKPGGTIYEVEIIRQWNGVDPTDGRQIAKEVK